MESTGYPDPFDVRRPAEGLNQALSWQPVVGQSQNASERASRSLQGQIAVSDEPLLQVPSPGLARDNRCAYPGIYLPVPPRHATGLSLGLPAPVHMHDAVQVAPPPKKPRPVLRYHQLDRAGKSVIANWLSRAHRSAQIGYAA